MGIVFHMISGFGSTIFLKGLLRSTTTIRIVAVDKTVPFYLSNKVIVVEHYNNKSTLTTKNKGKIYLHHKMTLFPK